MKPQGDKETARGATHQTQLFVAHTGPDSDKVQGPIAHQTVLVAGPDAGIDAVGNPADHIPARHFNLQPTHHKHDARAQAQATHVSTYALACMSQKRWGKPVDRADGP